MPSDKQVYEGAAVPVRRFVVVAAFAFAAILVCLGGLFGLYALWVNGPQTAVKPAPLANATAPPLETEQFRERFAPASSDPRFAAAQGYRWRDAAHTRVDIPIERAMAMTAARGARAFDPVEGVTEAGSKP